MLRRVTSSGIVSVATCLWCIMWWIWYKVLTANGIYFILNNIYSIANGIYVIVIDTYNLMS